MSVEQLTEISAAIGELDAVIATLEADPSDAVVFTVRLLDKDAPRNKHEHRLDRLVFTDGLRRMRANMLGQLSKHGLRIAVEEAADETA